MLSVISTTAVSLWMIVLPNFGRSFAIIRTSSCRHNDQTKARERIPIPYLITRTSSRTEILYYANALMRYLRSFLYIMINESSNVFAQWKRPVLRWLHAMFKFPLTCFSFVLGPNGVLPWNLVLPILSYQFQFELFQFYLIVSVLNISYFSLFTVLSFIESFQFSYCFDCFCADFGPLCKVVK